MASRQDTSAGAAAAASAASPAPASPDEGFSGDSASGTAPAAIDAFRVDCLMNARYHSAREAFLDSVHRWLMLGVILSGSFAVVDLVGADVPAAATVLVKAVLAALPVAFGALDLTFDLSNRARIHGQMKRRYFELLADVADRSKTVEQAAAAMHRCSADEEPAYHALLATAWNAAQVMVYGDEARRYALPWSARFLKQVFRFEGTTFDCGPAMVPHAPQA